MKILSKLMLAGALVALSSSVYAKSLNGYKCYALLEDNTFAVIDVEIKQKSKAQAANAAIAEGHKYPGKKLQRVAEIQQCVLRSEEFSDTNARKLDKLKLR
ncbi:MULTISPECIES: hypothetical protein [unclassified Pseudoalteromonas]|uniref:hypothetical protein n=1 Tax=unclassified Pseudoalteromonas TaxID=194690 RepID=UPI000CF6A5C5|nr:MULTISPECIES: hypothetical protein [unclassified Pseudoalteromonas]